MPIYQGPLRDQRPAAREALEMLLDDTARAMVPAQRPCEVRRPVAILREIAGVTFSLTNIAIEDGDIQFGTELLRRLVQELSEAKGEAK